MPLPVGVRMVKLKRLPENPRADLVLSKTKITLSEEKCCDIPAKIKLLIDEFPDIFKNEPDRIRDCEAHIHLKDDAKPIAWSARRVAFALRKPLEREMKRLEEDGIVEKVDPAVSKIEWATPIVVVDKGNGNVRVCHDYYVTLNQAIIKDHYVMPTFEELTAKIARGREYSIIDLRDAYLQMPIAESSQKYLVISTPMGYYKYKRLPFGISSAPAIFQRCIHHLLTGLPNVGVYLDDVIVTGSMQIEHLVNVFVI